MKESFCWSTGKMRHVSLAVAHHALAIQDQSGMHAYHCQDCGGWHVGHGVKRGRHLDPTQRPLGPRLSGNRRLRRKLGEALAAGNRRRAAAIVKLIQRFDAFRP